MVYRVRKQLVEEGFEGVLSRKPRAVPAVAWIFDGEKEAKLIALACSKPTFFGMAPPVDPRQRSSVHDRYGNCVR